MSMSKSEALQAIATIEKLCYGYGFPNTQSKNQILNLVREMRAYGPDNGYFREKLTSIEVWSDIGFSTRKFIKYTGGANQVTVWTLGDCQSVKSIIERNWPHQ